MITVFYATQTGNSEACAEWLKDALEDEKLPCRMVNLAEYEARQLQEERLALFVVSTYGEGDPPDDAIPFHESMEALHHDELAQLRYAVFALGDIDYTLFCGFGHSCDRLLAGAGASRLREVEECNLDQADRLPSWTDELIPVLKQLLVKQEA
ncbi:MAG: flavodoxin domain-containing protein [Verrucomicrobiota bacterium]